MKPTYLLAAVLLVGACDRAIGPSSGADGTYRLDRIEGTTFDGKPVTVIAGTLTIDDGAYDWSARTSIAPGDTGTVTDRGEALVRNTRVTLTSSRHGQAGTGGSLVPHTYTGELQGSALALKGPGWTYHWRRR